MIPNKRKPLEIDHTVKDVTVDAVKKVFKDTIFKKSVYEEEDLKVREGFVYLDFVYDSDKTFELTKEDLKKYFPNMTVNKRKITIPLQGV